MRYWATIAAALLPALLMGANPLRIFFVDVEGGQATLIVSPAGRSLLIDTGWEARDAKRIVAAAKIAGVTQIDRLIITHYHRDHVGGVGPLAQQIPIAEFFDHGPIRVPYKGSDTIMDAYEKAHAGKPHRALAPGDSIDFDGVKVKILASDNKLLEGKAKAANPQCKNEALKPPEATENTYSLGLTLQFGEFRFVDLGDILWNQEMALVCPVNLVGKADVILVTHHGKNTSFPSTLMRSVKPRAAVLNNAPAKGGSRSTIELIRESLGNEDMWQLHKSNEAAERNADEKFIANPASEDGGHMLELSAWPDGRFEILNSRTKWKKVYAAHRQER
jgi:competence protein ComEC